MGRGLEHLDDAEKFNETFQVLLESHRLLAPAQSSTQGAVFAVSLVFPRVTISLLEELIYKLQRSSVEGSGNRSHEVEGFMEIFPSDVSVLPLDR